MDRIIKVSIAGKTSLIMHNPAGSMGLPTSGKKRIPSPEEEAAASRYLVGFVGNPVNEPRDAPLGVPGRALMGSIKTGAAPFRISAKQYAKRVVGAGCRVDVDVAPLTRAGAAITDHATDVQFTPIGNYVVDCQRAVVDGSGIMRARARIDLPWDVDFDLIFDDELFDSPARGVELLRMCCDYAGKFCGLLDFRPSAPKSPGPHGRYTVTSFALVD